jgi:hypothetical protein
LSLLIVQLIGAILEICGFVAGYFLLAIYLSVKRLGGNLEKRHIYTIGGVALILFLSGTALFSLGASV